MIPHTPAPPSPKKGRWRGPSTGFRRGRSSRRWPNPWGETLEEGGVLVAEAGTGTGKTFAYLVPALLSGKKVIISTGTRTLQDQLYHRDLPLVSAALAGPGVPSPAQGPQQLPLPLPTGAGRRGGALRVAGRGGAAAAPAGAGRARPAAATSPRPRWPIWRGRCSAKSRPRRTTAWARNAPSTRSATSWRRGDAPRRRTWWWSTTIC
ncbi:MAG: hypothetical protein U5L11_09010 [Arhodomonas sp.]|nr:hypothetical protein [Arhodomonas sp.]